MLPGGQYAIGQAPGRFEVTVSSLRWRLIVYCQGLLFCFVAVPVCLWADQTDGEGQTGKLAYLAEHTHQAVRAQARGKQQTF